MLVLLYSFCWLRHANVVALATVGALATCAYLLSVQARSPLFFPLAVSCAFSVLLGACLGALCYEEWGFPRLLYSTLRRYHNVPASESGPAVADAARLVFSAESFLDSSKSAGFSADDGRMYCVAPIRDPTESQQADFWAVGEDCCSWQGAFHCDAAADAAARGGIMLFERGTLFGGFDPTRFELARRKAESMAGLTHSPNPVYLRWVETAELDALPGHYASKLWIAVVVCILLHSAMSAALAWVLCKPLQGSAL